MSVTIMTRSDARELAVHLIYSFEFAGGEEPQDMIALRLAKDYYKKLSEEVELYAEHPSAAQRAYITRVVSGVTNRLDELNELISKYAIGWDVTRISKLTRSILQLAFFEIQFVDDVPTGVAISEAVRMAKVYDGDDTGSFVNGILGTYARDLTSEVSE